MRSKIVALFPQRTEPVEVRRRHAAALRQCIAAIAEEACDGGFVLTGQALELAIAVLDTEKGKAAASDMLSSSIQPAK